MKKPDLTIAQLNSLLEQARKSSFFDYVAILTVVALNLRGASLVGQTDARMSPNPGLLIENLTPEGIRVFEKHGPKDGGIKQIPPVLRRYIEQIIGKRTSGRVFPRTRA